MPRRCTSTFASVLVSAAMIGCASQSPEPAEPTSLANQTPPVEAAAFVRGSPCEPVEWLNLPVRVIFEEEGGADLDEEARQTLDEALSMIGPRRNIELIRVEGHAGPREDNRYGLSLRRARAVVRYLQEGGMDTSRLVIVVHGDELPLTPGPTSAPRYLHQRVEFIALVLRNSTCSGAPLVASTSDSASPPRPCFGWQRWPERAFFEPGRADLVQPLDPLVERYRSTKQRRRYAIGVEVSSMSGETEELEERRILKFLEAFRPGDRRPVTLVVRPRVTWDSQPEDTQRPSISITALVDERECQHSH